jgi:hypothetical protein
MVAGFRKGKQKAGNWSGFFSDTIGFCGKLTIKNLHLVLNKIEK